MSEQSKPPKGYTIRRNTLTNKYFVWYCDYAQNIIVSQKPSDTYDDAVQLCVDHQKRKHHDT